MLLIILFSFIAVGQTAWPYRPSVNRTNFAEYSTTSNPRTTTPWNPSRTSKVICKNYRDPGIKEFPKMGDLVCDVNRYGGRYPIQDYRELLSRETIVRMPYDQEVNRYLKGIDGFVSKVIVLNLEDQHAFVEQIVIQNEEGGSSRGVVDVRIQSLEGQEVKLFVEVYGRKT